MFANGAAFGGDLISTDIMRGREHGLPSYNDYRQTCGLRRASSWSGFSDLISARVRDGPGGAMRRSNAAELCDRESIKQRTNAVFVFGAQNIQILQTLYAHPDDVDYYVGGLLERRFDTSNTATITSPVFQCVVVDQFRRYKEGDPYFYDLATSPRPFTAGKGQPTKPSRNIRKITLGKFRKVASYSVLFSEFSLALRCSPTAGDPEADGVQADVRQHPRPQQRPPKRFPQDRRPGVRVVPNTSPAQSKCEWNSLIRFCVSAATRKSSVRSCREWT